MRVEEYTVDMRLFRARPHSASFGHRAFHQSVKMHTPKEPFKWMAGSSKIRRSSGVKEPFSWLK